MAPQDYISRTNNKKKSPYKKNAEQVDNSVSIKVKFIGLITLAAITGFGYFLYSIKDNTPVQPSNNASGSQQTVTEQKASQGANLPKPPEEKWQYIDQLKAGSQVEPGEYEVEHRGPYKMQCGSFRTLAQANSMKAKMAFSGLSAKVSESKGSNGTWFKVFLGPYPRKRLAEIDKHKLKNNGITTCQIWLWR